MIFIILIQLCSIFFDDTEFVTFISYKRVEITLRETVGMICSTFSSSLILENTRIII
jgi:hypothetical protein